MTFITWACLRCVQELATILGPQNPTQRNCDLDDLWIQIVDVDSVCKTHLYHLFYYKSNKGAVKA